MKRTLIFFGILCMIFFLLFSSADRRTQFLTSLAGPGMLSLVKQASAKATALENFSTDTIAGIPVEESPRIALTFDDGPNARYTPILLDGLKKRNIRASFFLIGENIEGNEDILLQCEKTDILSEITPGIMYSLTRYRRRKPDWKLKKQITESMKLPEFTLLMYDRLSAHGSRIWNFLSPCFPYSGM